MTTKLDEIAPHIYRLSTLVPEIRPTGFTFNQFLLADLQPRTLALMHGSSFTGDGGAALRALADAYADRLHPTS